MLKKFIAYQKLLLNSIPPIGIIPENPSKMLFCCFVIVFMDILIFSGNKISTNSILLIGLPIGSVWMINRMLYNDHHHKLFQNVPVSRKYTVLNIFLLSIVSIFIVYLLYLLSVTALIGITFGIIYLANPKSFSNSPPESAVHQVIDTTKGNMLMLCILVIILFIGVAITLIKNKKLRLSSFAGFATIGYVLLFFLKFNMPISPSSDKVEFLESFSVMPQGNTILLCVTIATVIICIASVFAGYKLYVGKSNDSKYY
ncbi:hypothetical protein [Clostridium sp. FP1]|uniref:hypothetical protein n=1 Tax=Clostridium sp. FP1 TaxID=2724076 RepID=UPI0013E90995|nr:hypothetical protein [Clostridium sp. FP1]MBZ9636333.1 hypothetical protein [Clostridium sp. FP1]